MNFEVKNGCFCYNKQTPILNNINFNIKEGEILSILGPNGVGKTTLLKCILGLLPWKSGETLLNDKNIRNMNHKEFWCNIGYVPQAKLSTFSYTVDEMVLLGRNSHLKLLENPSKNDRKIAQECIDRIGIKYLSGKLCSKISGGELQMVLIARALATEPKILILDEPESNLDFKNQLTIIQTIKNLRDEQGVSSIINTHYPQNAISISDKSLILNKSGYGIFGNAEDIISEINLENAFGVKVKIKDFYSSDKKYTSVIPISIS